MAQATNSHHGLLLVISGPSGVGKTTIAHRVEQELRGVFSISTTTRAPSPRDQPGVDYDFVDQETFEKYRDQGEMLEWAEVFGQYYGTPRQRTLDMLHCGRLVILEIDVHGATQIKNQMPETLAIFIEPPDQRDLLDRLRSRRREDEAAIQRRYAKARDEIARAKNGKVYDHFVVNDDLDQATRRVIELVRERLRSDSLNDEVTTFP